MRSSRPPQPTSLHHHSLQSSASPHVSQSGPILGAQSGSRPGLERSHTFPTPPASASSLMTNQSNSYDWNNPSINSGGSSSQPLSIETGLSNARSMPTTPATTPPGNIMHGMPSYHAQSTYDNTKPYYSAAPSSHSQYAPQQPLGQPGLSTYGQSISSSTYLKSDMGPPSGRVQADSESEVKPERYVSQGGTVGAGVGDNVSEHESEYVHDTSSSGYGTNRSSYTYTTNPSISSLAGEHTHLGATDISSSPSQQNAATDRMTPRSNNNVSSQWSSEYTTPPRLAAPAALYNMVSDTRNSAANGSSADPYSVTSNSAPAYSSAVNGSMGSRKRRREDEEADRLVPSNGRDPEFDHKHRKTMRDAPILGGPVGGESRALQPLKPLGLVSRHR